MQFSDEMQDTAHQPADQARVPLAKTLVTEQEQPAIELPQALNACHVRRLDYS